MLDLLKRMSTFVQIINCFDFKEIKNTSKIVLFGRHFKTVKTKQNLTF